MPLIPLDLQPGFYRNGTEYQAKDRWRDGNLVRWREGAMRPVGGWDAFIFADGQGASTLMDTARAALAWKDNSGNIWIIWGSGNYAHVMNSNGTVTDVTPAGYTAGSTTNRFSWQWGTFGQIPVGCANTDGRLWEWDLNTANNLTQITNSPTSCTGLVVTDERFIFALGDGGDPRSIRWPDRDNRTVWTPATTNQAGGVDLKTDGEIRFGIQMRGETLIVTSKDAWVARYVGYPNVYEFNRIGNCSAVSGMCGTRLDDRDDADALRRDQPRQHHEGQLMAVNGLYARGLLGASGAMGTEGLYARGLFGVGSGVDGYDTPPRFRDGTFRRRYGGLFSLLLIPLLAGCETVTEVKEVHCDAVEFFPYGTTAEVADSVVYRGCEPPEWDGLVVRFR